jgi:outer membrane protein assembly factor BamB
MKRQLAYWIGVLIGSWILIGGWSPAGLASAQDWPQWMGPQRDNVWRESGIVDKFPAGGPPVLWRTPIAGGYAGPAVAQGRVFITDYVTADNVKVDNFERAEFSGMERVLCLSEDSGEVLWKHEYPVRYTVSYPAGPRCTPCVEEDRVYTLGAEGHLFCFHVADGRILWQKDLKETYQTKAALWGYSAHPLIDGDRLLTLAGGEGSHVVALDKRTGAEIWRASDSPETGYSPPTIIEYAGVRQLILLQPNAVVSLDADSGQKLWSVPYEASNGSIIMSPIRVGEYLYVAGYNNRSLLLKLQADQPGATEVWRDKRNVICPVNVQPFVIDDVVYGMDQKGVLRAVQVPSGERLWESDESIGTRPAGSETTFLVRHEDRFIMFNELGELLIAKLSPAGYEEIDRAKVIEPSNVAFGRKVVWSMPALANRRAYIRNDQEIICVDLAAK